MFTVRYSNEFDQWLRGLRDVLTRARLVKRLKKLEMGLLGDLKLLDDGMPKLREDFGARLAHVLHPARANDDPDVGRRQQVHGEGRHQGR